MVEEESDSNSQGTYKLVSYSNHSAFPIPSQFHVTRMFHVLMARGKNKDWRMDGEIGSLTWFGVLLWL